MTPPPTFDLEAFTRLADLTDDLAGTIGELAETVMEERRGRVAALESFEGSSVSAAEIHADRLVLDLTLDIIRLKAKIRADEFEHRFMLAWLANTPQED